MLTVNLFDANFRQSVCSVAYQEPAYLRYVRDLMEWDGVTIFTDAYILNPIVDQVKSPVKIGWLHEPECLWPNNYEGSKAVAGKFDMILTYSAELLAHPGYRFAPYGGVWINRNEWGIWPKSLLVSILAGEKLATEGHRVRREIADAVNPGQVDRWGYRGRPVDYGPGTKLASLAHYRFSIVTETCRQDNLFTEWLLDCFAAGTVPIYWGCPNLGEFFNSDGVLSFSNAAEALEIIGDLTPGLYEEMLPAVRDNFSRVGEWAITEDWIYLNVLREYA